MKEHYTDLTNEELEAQHLVAARRYDEANKQLGIERAKLQEIIRIKGDRGLPIAPKKVEGK